MVRIRHNSIGVRIGLGFGIIIAIMVSVGIFSVSEMARIQHDVLQLTKEYLPELSVADRLERNFFFIMYSMRSYEMTGEKQFYDDAMKYFEEVRKNLSEAQQLSDKYEKLAGLKEKAGRISDMLKEYEVLLSKTFEAASVIVSARALFDKEAASYMNNADHLLDIQIQSMAGEIASGSDRQILSERLKKIELVQQIIDTGDAVRIANFKFQALRNPSIAAEGIKQFDKIFRNLENIRVLIKKQENMDQIRQIDISGREYQKTMENVLLRWQRLENVSIARVKIASDIRQMAKETSDSGMKRVDVVAAETLSALSQISRNLFIAMILSVIIAMGIGFLITVRIRNTVNKIADFIQKFGNGDLRSEAAIDSNDEIGQMAGDLNASVRNLRSIMKELSDTTQILSSSSEELSSVSEEMASGAEEMTAQAMTVAGASEQIASGVRTVAAATEQSGASLANIAAMTEEMSAAFVHVAESGRKTSENIREMVKASEDISSQISAIASAAEEMTVSLNEVAKNTAQANRISQNANQRAQDVNARMNALSAASKKIGKIISLIKDIADQTNMLALNATIEAASAGAAGRGFAVVAGEIKELAKQSAEATDEISVQIEEIQSFTSDAVHAIEDIGKVIHQIAAINEMIASSSEEQNATSAEISKSVAVTAMAAKSVSEKSSESSALADDIARAMKESSITASEVAARIEELLKGVEDVARSADEAAKGVNDISKNIQGISTASKNTAIGASQTRESSKELAKMAASLSQLVNRFRV